MSEINTTKAASNIRRRIKSSKNFEGFKLRVFETSRQAKCFRTVCSFERSPIDINFSTYSYNPNSLISFQFFKQSQFQNQYEYNSRNWITSMNSLQGLFGFTNTYYKTGNVNTQLLFGTYKDNFPQNNYNLYYNYTYDNSNRLLNAINSNQGDMSFSVLNTYDKDGNITTLKRYGDNNIVTDDFNYQYYSGTNKLSKVTGTQDQYSYDLNGNVTRDTINYNFNIQYDHRNLITQFYHTDREAVSRPYTYATRYYYDESGNRVRKLEYFNTQTNPPLITDWNNPGNGWQLYNNEFYVKGVDGKDLATYKGNILDEWFVWGNDMVGKIKNDKAYYFYKDHLGSVRAVVNDNAQIVAAYDYDAWGYPLEGRSFNADSMKFKYTGKELDKESLYDYFGARYYDSRIGRWGQTEPLLEKYLSSTPYAYSINNPLKFVDLNGQDAIGKVDEENNKINIYAKIYYSTNSKFKGSFSSTNADRLKNYITEAQINWNKAGVMMEYKGKDYEVSFSFELIETNYENSQLSKVLETEGNNIALSEMFYVDSKDQIHKDVPAGVSENILRIFEPTGRSGTGSHELGHLMGIEHPIGYNDPNLRDLFIDVMSYGKYREGPRNWNVRQVIDKLNFKDTGNQLIKGSN